MPRTIAVPSFRFSLRAVHVYFSSGKPLGRVECTRSWVDGWRSRKAIVRVRARQTDESRSAGKP